MIRSIRNRGWVEVGLAGLSAALLALTLVLPQWIEALGFDPDAGSGSAEWWLVALLVNMTLAFSVLARTDFIRAARSAI